MRASQFFRKVWRFNALVIMVAGILAVAVLAFGTLQVLRSLLRQRAAVAVVNTDSRAQIREALALGRAIRIEGHPWLLVAIESDQQYDQEYFSKSTVAARNYGFVAASGPPRWLYPHNRFLVVDTSQLPVAEFAEPDRPTAIVSFVVVQQDTNGDERLTAADLSSLVFTKPDGTGTRVVLEHVRQVISQEMMGEQVIVLYEGSSGYARAVISAADFSQMNQESFELPKLGS